MVLFKVGQLEIVEIESENGILKIKIKTEIDN